MDMLQMAMKSFGLDPEAIKKMMQEAQDTFLKTCKHFDDRLTDIENRQKLIMEKIYENAVAKKETDCNSARIERHTTFVPATGYNASAFIGDDGEGIAGRGDPLTAVQNLRL